MSTPIFVSLPDGYHNQAADLNFQPHIMQDRKSWSKKQVAGLVGLVGTVVCAATVFSSGGQTAELRSVSAGSVAGARPVAAMRPRAQRGNTAAKQWAAAFSSRAEMQAEGLAPKRGGVLGMSRGSVITHATEARPEGGKETERPTGTHEHVLVGVAADSGCGKSTFMRRLTGIFGGESKPLGGGFGTEGGWETNTLVSDFSTVLCLDDYHLNDRQGRKESGLTALDERENNFDLMFKQMEYLKAGKPVEKPIYNHVNGTLDKPEKIEPAKITIIEGLHPMLDDRVNKLLDFSIYLDISDDIKFAWKIQRDMKERGHSLESIQASIEQRKPDFDKYVLPQRKKADIVLQVLPSRLVEDTEGKILRVRLIQRTTNPYFTPAHLLEVGARVEWTPCGAGGLQCAFPGLKLAQYQEDVFDDGEMMEVLEMDGIIESLPEVEYIEKFLFDTGARDGKELTREMIKLQGTPGFNDGTGFMQTLVSFKIREVYEAVTGDRVNWKIE